MSRSMRVLLFAWAGLVFAGSYVITALVQGWRSEAPLTVFSVAFAFALVSLALVEWRSRAQRRVTEGFELQLSRARVLSYLVVASVVLGVALYHWSSR